MDGSNRRAWNAHRVRSDFLESVFDSHIYCVTHHLPITSRSTLSSPSSQSSSSSSNSPSAFVHTPCFTAAGWLSLVINPLNVGSEKSRRPCFRLRGAVGVVHGPTLPPLAGLATHPALLGIWVYHYPWRLWGWASAGRRCGGHDL
jgi:hypothetical protein